MSRFERILGGLLGQALGDAWGMPALLNPRATWQKFGGWIEELVPAPDDHPVHAGLPAGRVTDDTEQAFALAEALLRCGGVTVEGVAEAIVAWYDAVDGDRCPFVGPSTRRAVTKLKKGTDPYEAGLGGDTNGGAMRASVVGLAYPADPEMAARQAALQCVPTHNTDVAMSGAAAVAAAVAEALCPEATLEDIVAAGIRGAETGRGLGPQWMGASVARRIELAVEIASASMPPLERIYRLYDIVGSTLATTEAVPAAFGILTMAKGEPLQAARYAAALSGDADTVGAMACAIAGAWMGASAFPKETVDKLVQSNPHLDFHGLARRLEGFAVGG
jgi:ADP-ribosylglycohydrolase